MPPAGGVAWPKHASTRAPQKSIDKMKKAGITVVEPDIVSM
jgi:hypothetical protein